MNYTEILQKSARLLEDIYNGKNIADIDSEVTQMEQEIDSIKCEQRSIHVIPRLLAAHNSENYSLYTGVFINVYGVYHNFYAGDPDLHSDVELKVTTENSISNNAVIILNDTELPIKTYKHEKDQKEITVITISNSPFFSHDLFNSYANELITIIKKFFCTPFDFGSDSRNLTRWIDAQKESLFIINYKFKNFLQYLVILASIK
jgi:hypothetical protein